MCSLSAEISAWRKDSSSVVSSKLAEEALTSDVAATAATAPPEASLDEAVTGEVEARGEVVGEVAPAAAAAAEEEEEEAAGAVGAAGAAGAAEKATASSGASMPRGSTEGAVGTASKASAPILSSMAARRGALEMSVRSAVCVWISSVPASRIASQRVLARRCSNQRARQPFDTLGGVVVKGSVGLLQGCDLLAAASLRQDQPPLGRRDAAEPFDHGRRGRADLT